MRFFRTPPLALRIALGCALAIELTGLALGLSFVPHAVADALRSGVVGMLPWLHGLMAALACTIAVIAIPFAAIKGGGAEGVRPASNGEPS